MTDKIVVLTGGVGGAKLVLGLCQVIPAGQITAIVNTGDDFDHLGLNISPDIDTLLYTLASKADQEKGWGREDESWNFMAALRSLGGEDWFQLGDGDLALHILRTGQLRAGQSLSAVTAGFAAAWGVDVSVLPMSDDPVSTIVTTDEGDLAFQRYFVERRCIPQVSAIRFEGVQTAKAAPGLLEAIIDPATSAIVIAPSNPYLSIDPILSVPGIRDALENSVAPVVAVSPIIGGKAVKGPTVKLMAELGLPVSLVTIAEHYEGLIDGLLINSGDDLGVAGIVSASADIMMNSLDDRARVAQATLALAQALR
ncbi:2-phospho-L-lactate transferase [Sphingobium sp. CR2-8]|uniref:2-phospho-L-lactate transferase n=1 Tax=Sphingobium sp. CR2-8 TaxID=1306534 RepID=UPI002DBB8E65|nr:2-phospho-L-lactate transferase [Sphingobium sp. CR2-8]MEC3909123.1 2-phospho-L-lactate transferase [Sphingobium sp. CR2-8]